MTLPAPETRSADFWEQNAERHARNRAPAWMVESSLRYAQKLRERRG